MTVRRILTIFTTVAGFVLGIGAALMIRGGGAQADPCFGLGELIASWTYTVTADSVENAEAWGGDLVTGEQWEARDCRLSPIEVATIDGPTGQIYRIRETVDYAIQYFETRPEELPVNRARAAVQAEFVVPDAPALQALLKPGCDAAWRTQDFPEQGLRLCFPSKWTVDSDSPAGVLLSLSASTHAGLNVHQPDVSASLRCETPTAFETPLGTVSVCAMRPQFGGQSHQLLLPDGIKIFVWVSDDATAQERATAFRVAGSGEALP